VIEPCTDGSKRFAETYIGSKDRLH